MYIQWQKTTTNVTNKPADLVLVRKGKASCSGLDVCLFVALHLRMKQKKTTVVRLAFRYPGDKEKLTTAQRTARCNECNVVIYKYFQR